MKNSFVHHRAADVLALAIRVTEFVDQMPYAGAVAVMKPKKSG